MKFTSTLAVLGLLLVASLAAEPLDPSRSPFADKPCVSYSGPLAKDSGSLSTWKEAPYLDYGMREIEIDTTGGRTMRQAPPAGVHPRIYFGPDDLPDLRKRLKETRCGRQAWNNILCWTEMMKGRYDDSKPYAANDLWNGSFTGLHGPVPLYRLSIPGEEGKSKYNDNRIAAGIYQSLVDGTADEIPAFHWHTLSLEAFRCLIEDDGKAAKEAAQAAITLLRLGQAARDADPKNLEEPPVRPVGEFQLAYIYDFLHGYMTPAQRKQIHAELAATTWRHDNYGTFNTAESSRSNWATFSYWLVELLAIEGEPGFNDLKLRGMYRGWRNLFTYGWFESGATFEGEAKNQLGMDGIMPFVIRESAYGFENLTGHPHVKAYVRDFLTQSINPMHTGFHSYDLLGGSRKQIPGATPMDAIGLKFMYPEDRAIDWLYRKTIGENYERLPDRPDGYFNALLFCAMFPSDYHEANDDATALGFANTFFCGERALMMTRSSWDKDASMLNMHTRQANGGHAFADRNAIMVAGAGRVWSPNGYASFRTSENSVVCIDGKSQNEHVPGRCVDFVETPDATFMVGDAKYTWDWDWQRLDKNDGYYTLADAESGNITIPPGYEPVTHSVNDFAFKKLAHDYLDWPHFCHAHWLKPKGALSPFVRRPLLPVRMAFRTAGLVRGSHPYIIVADDIRQDDETHRYDWNLALEYDIQISRIEKHGDGTIDIHLTGADPDQSADLPKEALPSGLTEGDEIPAGRPILLVKLLNRSTPSSDAPEPEIIELPNLTNPGKYSRIRRLVIPATSVAPEFKLLIMPYRQGQTLPVINWNKDTDTVEITSRENKDSVTFSPSVSGKTNVVVHRSGKQSPPREIIRVDREVASFVDELAEKRAKAIEITRAWVRNELRNFDPAKLEGIKLAWNFDGQADAKEFPGIEYGPGRDGTAMVATGSKEGIALPLDIRKFASKGFTISFWAKDSGEKGGYFFNSNASRGLRLGIENRTLRVDADNKWRWSRSGDVFNGWRHIAWTYDGKTMNLYIDGVSTHSSEATSEPIFAEQSVIAPEYGGMLDELLIFDRALSAEEIAKIVAVQTYRD